MSEPPSHTPPPPPETPSGSPPPPPSGTPPAGGPPRSGSDNRTLMIVLSYLGLFAIIPLVVEKDDPEIQWHAKHGLVLFATTVLLLVLIGIINFVITELVPILGCVTCFVPLVVGLAALAVHIMAMVKGVRGERLIIPGVSEFASKF